MRGPKLTDAPGVDGRGFFFLTVGNLDRTFASTMWDSEG